MTKDSRKIPSEIQSLSQTDGFEKNQMVHLHLKQNSSWSIDWFKAVAGDPAYASNKDLSYSKNTRGAL